jgi:hypothetical protein
MDEANLYRLMRGGYGWRGPLLSTALRLGEVLDYPLDQLFQIKVEEGEDR